MGAKGQPLTRISESLVTAEPNLLRDYIIRKYIYTVSEPRSLDESLGVPLLNYR